MSGEVRFEYSGNHADGLPATTNFVVIYFSQNDKRIADVLEIFLHWRQTW